VFVQTQIIRSFDFRTFLEREGTFGSGRQVSFPRAERAQWGWWAVKRRIIRSQVRWLGSPEGPFVSSMVWEVRQLICPTTFATRLFRLDWLMLCSLWISNFFDSWFGAGVKQASFSAAQVGCGVSALVIFLGFDWFVPAVDRRYGVWGINRSGDEA